LAGPATFDGAQQIRGGYEVAGMILFRDLKGAMRLDRSKDMSKHLSTYAISDFNALTPVLWKLWRS
jgi:hypothetical protein